MLDSSLGLSFLSERPEHFDFPRQSGGVARSDRGGCRRVIDFGRCLRKVGAVSLAHMAAGCDGRPFAGECTDSRGNDGGCGHLRRCADVPHVPGSPECIDGLAVLACITMLGAAVIALGQTDIKRVLAWSTSLSSPT